MNPARYNLAQIEAALSCALWYKKVAFIDHPLNL